MNKFEKTGIITSMAIGMPAGLITIAISIFAPAYISGEGLPVIGLIAVYGKAIIGLTVAFIISLWIAGKSIYADMVKSESILKTSFLYSSKVNFIIWTTFILITVIQNGDVPVFVLIIPPVIALIMCTALTTISIGFLITWIVKKISFNT